MLLHLNTRVSRNCSCTQADGKTTRNQTVCSGFARYTRAPSDPFCDRRREDGPSVPSLPPARCGFPIVSYFRLPCSCVSVSCCTGSRTGSHPSGHVGLPPLYVLLLRAGGSKGALPREAIPCPTVVGGVLQLLPPTSTTVLATPVQPVITHSAEIPGSRGTIGFPGLNAMQAALRHAKDSPCL